MSDRSLNYNSISTQYDRRYSDNDYQESERVLLEFAGSTGNLILEIGCGTGHWIDVLRQNGYQVLGLDPSQGMLEEARQKPKGMGLIRGKAEFLPLGDHTVDRVFCMNSFHHFSDHQRFVAEAFRVLKPGGVLLIIGLDPHTGLDCWSIYEYFAPALENDRKRYHPTARIRQMMAELGFKDCRTIEAQHSPQYLSARYVLDHGLMGRSITSQLTLLTEEEYYQGMKKLIGDVEEAESKNASLIIGADLRLYASMGAKPSTVSA